MAERLAERVRDSRAGNGKQQQGGQVATTEDESVKKLIATVRSMTPQYKLAMGAVRGAQAEQLVRDAITAIRQQPKLAKCDQASVLGGLMTFAQLGLRPHTALGHGWLLPMRNHGRMQATLVIGYKGYVKLAYNASALRDVRARTVREGDPFDIEYGTAERLVHRPAPERGAPTGYYCVVNLANGGQVFHYRTQAEMEEHRDLYAMSREFDWSSGRPVQVLDRVTGRPIITGPWRDFFEQMAHKTEWLGCTPWIPMSADLELAVNADSTVRLDLNPTNRDAMVGDHPELEAADPDGAVPADVVEDGPDAAQDGRERIVVDSPAPDAPDAEAGPEGGAGAADDAVPDAVPGPAPDGASDPDPDDPYAVFAHLVAQQAGMRGDAAIVAAGNLAEYSGPPPAALDGFPAAVVTKATEVIRGWIEDPEVVASVRLLDCLPADSHPVWREIEAAHKKAAAQPSGGSPAKPTGSRSKGKT